MRQAMTGLSRLLGSETLVISGETVALDPNVVESDVLRSGPANLNRMISGNFGHDAGPREVW